MSTRVVLVKTVLFFFPYFCKEYIKFCSINADTKTSMPRFPNCCYKNVSHTQSQYCGAKAKKNEKYSSKQNLLKGKHLHKQTVQSLQRLRSVY